MVKFKTTIDVEQLDTYKNSLGFFPLRMIVSSVIFDNRGATPEGCYYYINNEGSEIELAKFKNVSFSFADTRMAEQQLPPFDSQNIDKAIFQRLIEFTYIRLQMEAGRTFGTLPEHWTLDEETVEVLRINSEKIQTKK